MKIVFKIKEDDARNPGVIADCTGDNAGDTVGPDGGRLRDLRRHRRGADHLHPPGRAGRVFRVDLLVWIFVMRVMMIVTSVGSYCINEAFAKAALRPGRQDELRGAADHPGLADLDRLHRDDLRDQLAPDRRPGRRHAVVEALDDHHLRHAGRRDHPRAGEGLHLHPSRRTCRRW